MRSLVLFLMACKGATPVPEGVDNDGDGVVESEDCNDADPNIFPGAPERCDDVDDDCDGESDDARAVHVEGGLAAVDLAEALLLAQIDETIVLCPGTHSGATVRDRTLEGRGAGVIIDAGGVGSAIVAQGQVQLRNLTLTGGAGSPGPLGGAVGGGVNATDATALNLSDVVIEGNTADHGGGIALGDIPANLERVLVRDNTAVSGGGILVEGGTLTCADTEIRDNTAEGGGGGIRVDDGVVAGCLVDDNTAEDNGGGLYLTGEVELQGLTVSDNEAVVYGGGVYLLPGAEVELTGSTVSGNSAELGGGLFANPHGSVDLTATTLTNNMATAEGGGVYAWTASIVGGTLESNSAVDFGGGLLLFEGSSLQGGRIEANVAADGAGVRVRGTGLANLSGTQIVHNVASQNGGGLYVRETEVVLSTVLIQANDAAERGGGVYLGEGVVSGSDILISDNTAEIGGGVYASSAGASAVTGRIEGNTAETGAGVTALGSLQIDVELVENVASVRGGGLYTDGAGVVVHGDMVCTGNDAGEFGGGVYAQDASQIDVSAEIQGNDSPLGAGIYINGGSVVSLSTASDVSDNGTVDGGGGVRINDGAFDTVNATFAHNTPNDVYTVGNGTGEVYAHPVSLTCTQAGC